MPADAGAARQPGLGSCGAAGSVFDRGSSPPARRGVGAPQGRLLRLAERLLLAGPVALCCLLLHLHARIQQMHGCSKLAVSCTHDVPCMQGMQPRALCLIVYATPGSSSSVEHEVTALLTCLYLRSGLHG